MAPADRDSTQAVEKHHSLKHQHSASLDHSRSLVPMWDSSDPERAPPPLPMNPQSPSTSRAGVCSAIQSAHAALTEKARESGIVSSALAKRMVAADSNGSPEKRNSFSGVTGGRGSIGSSSGSLHKRMQSGTSVRDISLLLETNGNANAGNGNNRLPDKSAARGGVSTRPSTPIKASAAARELLDRDVSKSVDRDRGHHTTASPAPTAGLTPAAGPTPTAALTPLPLRQSTTLRHRPSLQSILGENTPPQSATMLALQNMPTSSTPTPTQTPRGGAGNTPSVEAPTGSQLAQNGSTALVRTGTPASGPVAHANANVDVLSAQILSLTSIATSLQKEMANLSRRSRDNATDLMSLKEATSQRDEDIRRSLRELINKANEGAAQRDYYGSGGLFLDSKPHNISTTESLCSKAVRPFALPRIPSPNSFAASLDRESSLSTPSLYGGESQTVTAMLERVIRDMGTKEGQELLHSRLTEILHRLSSLVSSDQFNGLVKEVRAANQERAVVPVPAVGGGGSGGTGVNGGRGRTFSFGEPHEMELGYQGRGVGGPMTQRVERLLQQNKDGRRESAPLPTGSANNTASTTTPAAAAIVNDDVLKVIKTVKDSVAQGGGLTAEVKALVRELRGEVLGMGREIGRRLDEVSSKASAGKNGAEATRQQVAKVVQEGLDQLREHMDELLREHRRQSAAASTSSRGGAGVVDYKEIYNAMRAALKDSQAAAARSAHANAASGSLRRDDIIDAVREAWESYKPEIEVQQIGLEREEVLACLKEGLKEYAPMQGSESRQGATYDEVFKAVVEGLKHFSPPKVETPAVLTRDEILDAVRECLEEFEFPVAPSAIGAEITREEVADAVKEGLRSFETAAVRSDSGPGNDEVLARLRTLEDTMRAEFEAASKEARQRERMPSQESVVRDVAKVLDSFRDTVSDMLTKATETSRDVLRKEVESLHEAVNSSIVPVASTSQHAGHQAAAGHAEILRALKEGMDAIRAELAFPNRHANAEILDALQEGLGDLRASIDRMVNKPNDLTATDEVMDALKTGLDGVRSDIEALREEQSLRNERAVTTVPSDAVVPAADVLRSEDIKNLEALIMQLRVKVEAMEPAASRSEPSPVCKEDLCSIEEMLRSVQESVANGSSGREREAAPPSNDDMATREDVQAIETILRNTKARLDDLIDGEQAVRKDHIDAVETLVLETKETLKAAVARLDEMARKDNMAAVEALVGQLAAGLDEMKEQACKQLEDPERVTKTDVEAVEAACLDIKASLEHVIKADLASLPSREDVKRLDELVQQSRESVEASAAANARAMEDRQAEIVGLSDKVSEVKAFLEEFRDTAKKNLEDGALGIEALAKLLETVGETVGRNANVGRDLADMFETMKAEFDESRAGVVGAKLESDERFQQTTETLAAKIDSRVDELVQRYDEFQAAMEDRARAGEARDAATTEAVVETKAVAEELKMLVDTLGSAVTDSLEKMEEASKTVFGRVEDLLARSDEHHSDGKAEHQMTRDAVKQAVGAVEGVQSYAAEYQPKILDGIRDLLLVVGQHYEHSKEATAHLQEKIEEAKPPEMPPLPPPPEKYDDTEVRRKLDLLVDRNTQYDDTEVRQKLDVLVSRDTRYDDTEVRQKLDLLVNRNTQYDDTEVRQKLDVLVNRNTQYDDTEVRGKLDVLVDRTANVGIVMDALARQDTLEKLAQLAARSSAELSEFLAAQTKRIEEEREDRETQLRETDAAIERALARKELLEASVADLREEEGRLKANISAMRAEQEQLSRKNARLAADLSSLETALRLRREELEAMEVRADSLERRILEGVMDHSRIMIMSKTAAKNKSGHDIMSRKRVQKSSSAAAQDPSAAADSPPARKPAAAVAGANIALASKQSLLVPGRQSPSTARRILSLSQISGNAAGGSGAAPAAAGSPFKRSQSVRHAGAPGLRKGSWTSSSARRAREQDKENDASRALQEMDEDISAAGALCRYGASPESKARRGDARQSSSDLLVDDESLADSRDSRDDDGATSDSGTLRRRSRSRSRSHPRTRSSLGTTATRTTDRTDDDYTDSDDESRRTSSWSESNASHSVTGNEVVLLGR